jgi:hypothetical protein
MPFTPIHFLGSIKAMLTAYLDGFHALTVANR